MSSKKVHNIFVFFFVFVLFLIPQSQGLYGEEAAGTPAPPFNYKLEIPIGTTLNITNLSEYIRIIYQFAVSVGGIVAVAMLVAGGFTWVFGGGKEDQITKAKERISGALWGLLILLTSYVLLNIINPAIVSLKGAQIPKIVAPEVVSSGNGLICEWFSRAPGESTKAPDGYLAAADGCTSPKPAEREMSGIYYLCYCKPGCALDTGSYCAVDKLMAQKGTCFENNSIASIKASGVCHGESGGDPNKRSHTDTCRTSKDQNSVYSYAYSLGLFQINIKANASLLSSIPGGTACSNIFTTDSSQPCLESKIINGKSYCYKANCWLSDGKGASDYDACVQAITNIENNLKLACSLSNNGEKWSPWSYNNTNCGY